MGKRELNQLREEQERLFKNYTMTRNGIRDHIEAGRFSPFSFGIYEFLKLYASYETMINWTNAQAVATTFSSGVSLRSVQDAFHKLRDFNYIDYPVGGAGKGQIFPVAILKGEPTDGVLKGSRLIGFADKDLQTVIYEFPCASRAQDLLKTWVGVYIECVHDVRCTCAECGQAVRCGVSLQDIRLKRPLRPFRLENTEDEIVVESQSEPEQIKAQASGKV